jgi:hypothetical protein
MIRMTYRSTLVAAALMAGTVAATALADVPGTRPHSTLPPWQRRTPRGPVVAARTSTTVALPVASGER